MKKINYKNTLTLVKFSLVGGLCSFALSFLIFPFLPASITTSVAANIGLNIAALLAAIGVLIFVKRPNKFPIFVFFLGFVLVSKLFEVLFVTVDRLI